MTATEAGAKGGHPDRRGNPALHIDGLWAGYGDADVVRGVSIDVSPGEIVGVIGPNGSGKSTLLKATAGIASVTAGVIQLADVDVSTMRPEQRVRAGIGYVPQVNNVFPSLSVEENLKIGGHASPRGVVAEAMEDAFTFFPAIAGRRRDAAGVLSGGEKQMLAIARALMVQPRVLLLDEPAAALSPKLRHVLFERIRGIAASSVAVVLVEQNAMEALKISDHACVLVMGEIAAAGPAADVATLDLGNLYFGGGAK